MDAEMEKTPSIVNVSCCTALGAYRVAHDDGHNVDIQLSSRKKRSSSYYELH